MSLTHDKKMSLKRILKDRAVTTMFQPLISMKRGKVFCVEGLSRGILTDSSELMPADTLFSLPQSGHEPLQLDRLCREKTLATFVPHYRADKSQLISINSDGVQITDTFSDKRKIKTQKRFIDKPAELNTDNSLKDYYLPLKARLRSYTTEPYISMATGNRCTTIAAFFRDRCGEKNILCIDLDCEVTA